VLFGAKVLVDGFGSIRFDERRNPIARNDPAPV